MKNGAIMGNVGHFDVEIDSKFLLQSSKSVKEVRPNLDECTLKNGKVVYLIGQGRLANLVAAEGHPPEVMAQSFSNQILSVLYILKNHKKMENKIINVPEEIDKQVAVDALNAMNEYVYWIVDQAQKKCAANGRKTIRPYDILA